MNCAQLPFVTSLGACTASRKKLSLIGCGARRPSVKHAADGLSPAENEATELPERLLRVCRWVMLDVNHQQYSMLG